MRLKLRNFRYHEAAEWTIEDSGLVLLTGASGSGKSTLLKAIIYALFGKVRKPYSFGSKSCSVTLEFMDMIIVRTSNPNRLLACGLEDEPAQCFINERLGMNYEEFMLSSYVPQKNNSSLLSMSPTDQFATIQTIALKDERTSTYIKQIKVLVKNLTERLATLRAKFAVESAEVDVLTGECAVPVTLPLLVGEDETIELTIQKYRDRLRTFGTRIGGHHAEKAAVMASLQELQAIQDQIDAKIVERDALAESVGNARLETAREELAAFPIDLDVQLTTIRNGIKCIEARAQLDTLEASLQESRQLEVSSRRTKIAELEKLLAGSATRADLEREAGGIQSKLDEFAEYSRRLEDYENCVNLIGMPPPDLRETQKGVEWLKNKLLGKTAQLTDDLETHRNNRTEWAVAIERQKMEKERVWCPSCNCALRFKEKELVVFEGGGAGDANDSDIDYQKLIDDAIKQSRLLESERKGLQKLYNKVETLDLPSIECTDQTFYDALAVRASEIQTSLKLGTDRELALKRLRKELETESFGAGFKGLKDSVLRETGKFETLLSMTSSELLATRESMDADLARLMDLKAQRTVKVAEVSDLERSHNATIAKYTAIVKKLVDLNHKLSGINRGNLLKKLGKLEDKIALASLKQQEDTAVSDQVDAYLRYVASAKKLEEWKTKADASTTELKMVESRLTGLLGLRDILAKAELMAVDSVIATINEHTGYYLDTFFGEHKLSAVIGTVDDKIVNTIEYKGNSYAGVAELSGGEFDRVTLASICGINTMLNSPILLLDESLSSLDADTNTEIINFLKELGENKLILVCSHEAVRGIFDDVIDFE